MRFCSLLSTHASTLKLTGACTWLIFSQILDLVCSYYVEYIAIYKLEISAEFLFQLSFKFTILTVNFFHGYEAINSYSHRVKKIS